MKFQSKTESYLYALYVLDSLLLKYRDNERLTAVIQKVILSVRQNVENHEQNPRVVSNKLITCSRELEGQLEQIDHAKLRLISSAINKGIYQQSLEDKWENPLGRRFESQLQIELLQNPTTAMMVAVKKISEKLLELMNTTSIYLNETDQPTKEYFLNVINDRSPNPISFGLRSSKMSYEELERILVDNHPSDLVFIMLVHFKFGASIIRHLSDYGDNASEIIDQQLYQHEHFLDRGRGNLQVHHSQLMGLLINEHDICNRGLPSQALAWEPDAKEQDPDFTSPYVRSLINQDVPYVAGPSGMTCVFMGQMLTLKVLSELEEQSYVAAITAYMVSGGFHSLHEVLGPIAFCLPERNLLPGYIVNSPEAIKNGTIRPPPYHVFYEHQSRIDPEFEAVINLGWKKLNSFFRDFYIQDTLHLLPYEQLVIPTKNIATTLQFKVLSAINNYLEAEKLILNDLSPIKNSNISCLENYKRMLIDAKTDFQAMTIIYALLKSNVGGMLKNQIAEMLGFASLENTITYLEQKLNEAVIKKIHVKYPAQEYSQQREDQLNNYRDFFIHIATQLNMFSDNGKYMSEEDCGPFYWALHKLKTIEQDLELNNLPSNNPRA